MRSKCFLALCAACLALFSPAFGVTLDTFEDGSAIGWNVVGHGAYMAKYRMEMVSPGHKSSFALRLTRDVPDGWCGVAISGLQKLKANRCDGIRVTARNADGVARLLIDAHCSDGTRWWCKVPLPADGGWKVIHIKPESFGLVENHNKLEAPRLDMVNMTSLYLTIDEHEKASQPPWRIEIDDVALGTGAPLSAKTEPTTPLRWRGAKVKVAVMDGEAFLPVRRAPPLAESIVNLLCAAGCNAGLVPPIELASALDAGDVDVLVLTGPHFVVGDERRVLAHLGRGKSLWCIGTAPALSQPMLRSDRTWQRAADWKAPPQLGRILDGSQVGRHWLQLSTPAFTVTPAGRKWWPDLPAQLPATKCAFLSATDSTINPCTPPWVENTPILTARYRQRNWIQGEDVFTGWVMVKFSHRAGPFQGASILFSGMAYDGHSMLHPANARFANATLRCVEELARPVADLWPAMPKPPLAGLGEITRSNFFTYPGPIFAPLNFDGLPAADPTFWEDSDTAGFNAMHVEVPFLADADADGELIDWKQADTLVRLAREHGKKVIFDPYTFRHWRWRWAGSQTNTNADFRDKFAGAMGKLAARYKDDPTVVAVFATTLTTGYASFGVDKTEHGLAAWQTYVRTRLGLSLEQATRRYGTEMGAWSDLPLPERREGNRFNLGPLWSDYLDFFIDAHCAFVRATIRAIRKACPDMPVLIRGPYLDVGIHMDLAAEFENVAPHCECIETSVDVGPYFRGLAETFGVPIVAENGWPKSRGGPLRFAMADYLMNGYRAHLYSFGGPRQARPGILDFHKAQKLARKLRRAQHPNTSLALLIPDTTLYASNPPSFSALERLPHIEFAMERSGFSFRSVSAQFPKLDGVKILLDDGQNQVLTPRFRGQLVEWVRDGGTLIAFPKTGGHDLRGGAETLPAALGVGFDVPTGKSHTVSPVGKGRVVVMAEKLLANRVEVVPELWDVLEEMLERFGAPREVVVRPRVNVLRLDDAARRKTYLVLSNKSPQYVAAYFRESHLPAAEEALPDLDLVVTPSFAFTAACDALTGKALKTERGEVHIHVPKTDYAVIEFDTK